jgi:hypothetical protein
MHASQWAQLSSRWTTYEELRRDGLPSDRRIIELIEKYRAYSHQVTIALSVEPPYRSLVRRLVPIDIQDAYWDRCYSLEDAVEVYLFPCPPPDDVVIGSGETEKILAHPEIAPTLRNWTSLSRIVGDIMAEQQAALGQEILEQIDDGRG